MGETANPSARHPWTEPWQALLALPGSNDAANPPQGRGNGTSRSQCDNGPGGTSSRLIVP